MNKQTPLRPLTLIGRVHRKGDLNLDIMKVTWLIEATEDPEVKRGYAVLIGLLKSELKDLETAQDVV